MPEGEASKRNFFTRANVVKTDTHLCLSPAWSRPLLPFVMCVARPCPILSACGLTFRDFGEDEAADGDSAATLQGALVEAKACTHELEVTVGE